MENQKATFVITYIICHSHLYHIYSFFKDRNSIIIIIIIVVVSVVVVVAFVVASLHAAAVGHQADQSA